MKSILRRLGTAAAGAALLGALTSAVVSAATVTIQVNGNVVNFDQPPVERTGRVFVPLRGVFEKLGASVVYQRPVINATGNGHNISLTIGSTTATIDGQHQPIDVAPFLVGSRTLVPLRFVAQALGATVNYNNGTRVVAITSAGGNGGGSTGSGNAGAGNTGTGNQSDVQLVNLSPSDGGVTSSKQPTISGNFSSPVDPNTVRIKLDSRDITSDYQAYVGTDSFSFRPGSEIPARSHTVEIAGKTSAGASFDRKYTFTSGIDATKNFIQEVTIGGTGASNGQKVNSTFTVTGTTLPNARVTVILSQQPTLLNGILGIPASSSRQVVTADSSGRFSASLNTADIGNPGNFVLALQSTEPTTRAGSNLIEYTLHT
ncbi:MAG: copper amine oxidase N-terminal domain-containing protein [Candidatus Eremiobacteraeota bacterium]|nr:copper amine oxidase N-terminal domain-containing protein [Candidatus Eremiobacteraeota bacterium]